MHRVEVADTGFWFGFSSDTVTSRKRAKHLQVDTKSVSIAPTPEIKEITLPIVIYMFLKFQNFQDFRVRNRLW